MLKWPIFKPFFLDIQAAETGNTCLKTGKKEGILNGLGSVLQTAFSASFGPCFGPRNGSFSSLLENLGGPELVTMGLEQAKTTCLSIPNGPGLLVREGLGSPELGSLGFGLPW